MAVLKDLIVSGVSRFVSDMFADDIHAASFVKNGGLSTQFLKADGSVDSMAYAPLASPEFTGTPTAPTASDGTNSTQIATTAFVNTALNKYLPTAGGTMTGAIERQYNSASNSPVLKIGTNNKDIQLFKVYSNDVTYSDTVSAYGYSLKYIGTGSGVTNYLRLIADNQTSTQLTAISVNQNGQVGILCDPNTSYALSVTGNIKVTGTVSSTRFIVPNNTGFLKADGSVDTNTYLTSSDISTKADKVTSATNGDFAGLDSNGNLTDSGHKHGDYVTAIGTSGDNVTWTKNGTDNPLTVPFATKATNLTNAPVLASGTNDSTKITVKAGEKTSNEFTVPYATTSGKIGSSTVGSDILPVYINSGQPMVISRIPGSLVKGSGINSMINGTNGVGINPAINGAGMNIYRGGNVRVFLDNFELPYTGNSLDMLFDGLNSTYFLPFNPTQGQGADISSLTYSSSKTYSSGDIVIYNNTEDKVRWYRSRTNNNTNNKPSHETDNTYWEYVSGIGNESYMAALNPQKFSTVSILITLISPANSESGVSLYWRTPGQHPRYITIEKYTDANFTDLAGVCCSRQDMNGEAVSTVYCGNVAGSYGKYFKFTFDTFSGTSFWTFACTQIAFTGLIGGIEGTVVMRKGGSVSTMFGDFYPNIDSSINLGTSSKYWNNVYANKFIKKGGTSSQFLKADGSVDSNAYITSAALPSLPLSIANGGTGQTTGVNAANALIGALPQWTADPSDSTYLIIRDTGGSPSYGQVQFSTVWNYISGKLGSVFGLTSGTDSSNNPITNATAPASTSNSTQVATTAFVKNQISTKADKVNSAINGDFAGLNSSGNLTDSGYKHSDFVKVHPKGHTHAYNNYEDWNFIMPQGSTNHDYIKIELPVSAFSESFTMYMDMSIVQSPSVDQAGRLCLVFQYSSIDRWTRIDGVISGHLSTTLTACVSDTYVYISGIEEYGSVSIDKILCSGSITQDDLTQIQMSLDTTGPSSPLYCKTMYGTGSTLSIGNGGISLCNTQKDELSTISISDISSAIGMGNKADKVSGATSGDFAGLDANGNLTDSGHNHSDYVTNIGVDTVNNKLTYKTGTGSGQGGLSYSLEIPYATTSGTATNLASAPVINIGEGTNASKISVTAGGLTSPWITVPYATSATDSNAVHLTGAETITGLKTISGTYLNFSGAYNNSGITLTSSTTGATTPSITFSRGGSGYIGYKLYANSNGHLILYSTSSSSTIADIIYGSSTKSVTINTDVTIDSAKTLTASKFSVPSATAGSYIKADGTGYGGAFTGATSSAAGGTGLVPAPNMADNDKFLKGDGTWSGFDDLYLRKTGGSLLGDLSMTNHVLTGLKDPVNDTDAVNKRYLESVVGPADSEVAYPDPTVDVIDGTKKVSYAYITHQSGSQTPNINELGFKTPMEPNSCIHIFVYSSMLYGSGGEPKPNTYSNQIETLVIPGRLCGGMESNATPGENDYTFINGRPMYIGPGATPTPGSPTIPSQSAYVDPEPRLSFIVPPMGMIEVSIYYNTYEDIVTTTVGGQTVQEKVQYSRTIVKCDGQLAS